LERLWQREQEGRMGEKSSNQGLGELEFVMIKQEKTFNNITFVTNISLGFLLLS
jgi:hypothetical protein